MVQNAQVARHHLVLQHSTRGYIDALAVVGDNDDRASELDVGAKGDIAGHSQMIQLKNMGNRLKPGQEMADFLEMVTKFDERHGVEHALRVDRELAMDKRIQVGRHEEQVRRRLDGQETRTGHVDTVGILEMLDTGTDGRLELDHLLTTLGGLVVDDDLQLHGLLLHDALDGLEVDPQVVGVEDLELLDRLEVLNMLVGHLGNLEQTDVTVVINEGTALDIGLGLVGDLHHELGVGLDHVVEDVEIDGSAEVIDVGDKEILLTLAEQLIEETRVIKGLVQVTVTRRVPLLDGRAGRTRDGKKRFLVDTGMAALVEGGDADVVGSVLLNDATGLLVGIERVHEDEGHVHVMLLVEVLEAKKDNKQGQDKQMSKGKTKIKIKK